MNNDLRLFVSCLGLGSWSSTEQRSFNRDRSIGGILRTRQGGRHQAAQPQRRCKRVLS